jgi:hypothetical protein
MTTNNSVNDYNYNIINNITPAGVVSSWGYHDTNMEKVMKRLEIIEERLLIVEPDLSLHEKYPALKEAYEQYKIIEKLVK